MRSNMFSPKRLLSAALMAATGLATYTAVSAEQMEEITIEAERPGRSAIGAPIETVTTKRVVSYADLSLTTASGAKVLETRIRDAATSACTELERKYPVSAEGDSTRKCIDDATTAAMIDARNAIDVARKESPGSYAAVTPAIQRPEEVVVEAVSGGARSALGAPIQTVKVSRVVSYADISLTTDSGVNVLENRVREAARQACSELVQKYPIAAEGDTPKKCFDNAVAGAMIGVRKAVESAQYAAD